MGNLFFFTCSSLFISCCREISVVYCRWICLKKVIVKQRSLLIKSDLPLPHSHSLFRLSFFSFHFSFVSYFSSSLSTLCFLFFSYSFYPFFFPSSYPLCFLRLPFSSSILLSCFLFLLSC